MKSAKASTTCVLMRTVGRESIRFFLMEKNRIEIWENLELFDSMCVCVCLRACVRVCVCVCVSVCV